MSKNLIVFFIIIIIVIIPLKINAEDYQLVVYKNNKEISRSIGQTNKEKIYYQIKTL